MIQSTKISRHSVLKMKGERATFSKPDQPLLGWTIFSETLPELDLIIPYLVLDPTS